MCTISRRAFIAAIPVLWAVSPLPPALAYLKEVRLRDVWPEIESGNFAAAAARFEQYLRERPIDHEARAELGLVQFAAGEYADAAANLEREAKLQSGYAQNDDLAPKLDWVAACHYLAVRRSGQEAALPTPHASPSLLALLGKAITLDQFLGQVETMAQRSHEKARETLALIEKITKQQGVDVPLQMPPYDPAAVRVEYTCVARCVLGEQSLCDDDLPTARDHLKAAIQTEAAHLIQYHIAKAELARLG